MTTFSKLPDFEKELSKLEKKYPSLRNDLADLEEVLLACPTGIGKNFIIIHSDPHVKVVKAKVHCESLRDRSIRVVYSFHEEMIEFVYIEMYFKGVKENHDDRRLDEYLSGVR